MTDLYIRDSGLWSSESNLERIDRIVMRYTDFDRIPLTSDERKKLKNVTAIKCIENKNLKDISAIVDFPKITKLDLSENGIEEIPWEIHHLSQLQDLDLSNNKIKKLPESVGNITSLNSLKLKNNDIALLPDGLFHLNHLISLDLRGNPLKSLFPLTEKQLVVSTLNVYDDDGEVSDSLYIPIKEFPKGVKEMIVDCNRHLQNACKQLENFYLESPREIFNRVIRKQTATKREFLRLCAEAKDSGLIESINKVQNLPVNFKSSLMKCIQEGKMPWET